ncbi:MAG: hypothetical protein HC927_04720 [Deltaproteobacteria bacterium]|nr:hypothetical protein [Deltaproteobacteria bacterium]
MRLALGVAREAAKVRLDHYEQLRAKKPDDENSAVALEKKYFDKAKSAKDYRETAHNRQVTGTILSSLPTINIFPPSASFGGLQLANVFYGLAGANTFKASNRDYSANNASVQASFARRKQDWDLQKEQAWLDMERLDHEKAAGDLRVALAKRELEQHDRRTEQSREIDDYMRSKFSNRDLYDWMIGQLSTLYFQAYQLAFDQAKRAERAYRHELAIPASEPPIIKYGYWDSLRKGLLAGDRLAHDLERLDLAYMDRDVRELELRKSVSLAALSPGALQDLREAGECSFGLPEVIFDLDHPGHYLRRIRAVRLTIPAVVGPYTTLGATLELGQHEIRETVDPESYVTRSGAGQAIATSTAMQDGGVFNLDFRDERYLPFEYAGVISNWTLRLPQALRQFDYRTIEDVVIHIDYTARDGGAPLRTACESALVTKINEALAGEQLVQIISVVEAFPNEWEAFFAVDGGGNHVLTLPVGSSHFPYFARRNGIEVSHVACTFLLAEDVGSVANIPGTLADIQASAGTFGPKDGQIMTATFTADTPAAPAPMSLTIDHDDVEDLYDAEDNLDRAKLVGMVLVIRYSLVP